MITYETILHGIKWDAVTDHLKTAARPGLSQVSDRTSVLEVLSHHGCNITHKALTLRVTYAHSKPRHKVTHPCHAYNALPRCRQYRNQGRGTATLPFSTSQLM